MQDLRRLFSAADKTPAVDEGARRPGRILAVKWGVNPNSSSLGVDVTFLLFGLAAITAITPVISTLLRARLGAVFGGPGEGSSSDGSSPPTAPASGA